MLRNNFTGETMIFRNDKGFYSTTISNTKKNQDGTTSYDNAYINVNFKKGVDIPNKTKINVTNGWLTFDKYDNKQTGKKETYWKIFINEYTIVGASAGTSTPQNTVSQDVIFSPSDPSDLPF